MHLTCLKHVEDGGTEQGLSHGALVHQRHVHLKRTLGLVLLLHRTQQHMRHMRPCMCLKVRLLSRIRLVRAEEPRKEAAIQTDVASKHRIKSRIQESDLVRHLLKYRCI